MAQVEQGQFAQLAALQALMLNNTLLLTNATSRLLALETLNVAQSHNMDDFFLCMMGALVFLMASLGFACLEAGSVRSTHVTSLFMYNTMNLMVAWAAYWIIGFTFAFGPGGNTIFGWGWVASGNMSDEKISLWFFQATFAATSASITSGAIAERTKLTGYLIFVVIFAAFTYPWATHWTWGGGWLEKGDGTIGYQDFAGSGAVHIVGGGAALVGAIILGPRTGRFRELDGVVQPNPFGGHSTPFVTIGGLILFFGFLGFNGGSQLHISQPGDGPAVALAIMNTTIAGAFGLIVATLLKKWETSKWSLLTSVNGGLAGMVSICAGANLMYQWGACCTGAIAGALYYAGAMLVTRLRIDDPVDTVSVHFVSGVWGALAQPIFKRQGILVTWTKLAFKGLGWNVLGSVALFAWTATISAICFLVLRKLGWLRCKMELEFDQDTPVHGEPAYPEKFNPHFAPKNIVLVPKLSEEDTRNLCGNPVLLLDTMNLRDIKHDSHVQAMRLNGSKVAVK